MKRQKILILAVSIFFAALFLFGALAILAAEKGPSKSDVAVSFDLSVELRGYCAFVSMEIFRTIF